MSRIIKFETLNNTRDLGGISTKDGRHIKKNRLIRSGSLGKISEKDKRKIQSLVSTIVDFRYDKEVEEEPFPVIEGVEYIRIPVFEDRIEGVGRDDEAQEFSIEHFMHDAEYAESYMAGIYRCFVTSDNCKAAYRKFIDVLLKDHEKAVLWNCSAGKDRTGFASLLIQEILGVRRLLIVNDYLRTNYHLRNDLEQIFDMLRKKIRGFDKKKEEALTNIFVSKRIYVANVYNEAERLYGSFEGFVREGLRVTDEEVGKLKKMYLE